jgi:CheY-like chemotaxis protein
MSNENSARNTVSENLTTSPPPMAGLSFGRIGHSESTRRRTILICEDDEGICELLVDALQEEGFTVVVARDGREALEQLQHGDGRYLVLLDLMMPRISGYEILEHMNRDPQLRAEHIVIVVSATGFVRPLSRDFLEKRIVRGMLKKPFELDDLFALVQRWA